MHTGNCPRVASTNTHHTPVTVSHASPSHFQEDSGSNIREFGPKSWSSRFNGHCPHFAASNSHRSVSSSVDQRPLVGRSPNQFGSVSHTEFFFSIDCTTCLATKRIRVKLIRANLVCFRKSTSSVVDGRGVQGGSRGAIDLLVVLGRILDRVFFNENTITAAVPVVFVS